MDIGTFYDVHSYPPPVDDLNVYRRRWDDARRRADASLFWPDQPYRDRRNILVAGCGTMQAARYAVRWPRAHVVGIDVSANSINYEKSLKRKYALDNLEVRALAVERATDLHETFDHVVCTGVLHHLPDPDAGLRALHDVLDPDGAMHLMVYAPYGRAGIYLLQEYCRRLRVGWTPSDVRELAQTLVALPPNHPLAELVRRSHDFASEAGIADALLHPRDRAYSVPELLAFLDANGMRFGRWVRQAPYLPQCGSIGTTPHAARLRALPSAEQYAAIELFRGTMVRHSVIAYRSDNLGSRRTVDFTGDAWKQYVPIGLPDTVTVREQLPDGASAVLINRNHTYPDLYLPVDAVRERLLAAVDGGRTIAEIAGKAGDLTVARAFFEELWRWDQVVFDISSERPIRKE